MNVLRRRSSPAPSRLVVAVAIGLLLAGAAGAQYFGRNKVQYEKFDFQVYETPRFDLYFYPPGNRSAPDAARMAERWYDRLSEAFGYQFTQRQPIVLYADHADFQQTDITGGLIGEGTGGFTEPLKNRVVLPFTATFADTDHVLGHELVHAFQYDISRRLTRGEQGSLGLHRLPLWMVEGLAEYLSQGREDAHTAMWMRDAVLREDLPDFKEMSRDPRYNPYQYGQAFWAYVGGRWGDPAVLKLFALSLQVDAETAFQEALATTPDEVVEGWHQALRQAYEPVVEERRAPSGLGEPVLGEARGTGRLNLAPALSPDGRWVAFLSTKELFSIDLFLADARTGEVVAQLFSAASDPHMDSLRFIDSAGTWSPDGRQFAFIGVAEGTNQVVILDVEARRVERRISVPEVGGITSPAWSPDGRSIAFSGMTEGASDLYRLDLASGRATRLTDDRFAQLQPTWSPDGTTLAFVTDQGPGTDLEHLQYAPVRLARMPAAVGPVELVEPFPGSKHIDPHYAADGSLTFVADPGGVSDLFRLAADGTVTRLTYVATGVSGITELAPAIGVAANGDVMFSVFRGGDYDVFRLDAAAPPPAQQVVASAERSAAVLPPAAVTAETVVSDYLAEVPAAPPQAVEELPLAEYRPRLTLDFVGPAAVGTISDRYGFGVGGSVSAFFSDVLGNHQLGIALQGGTTTGDGFGSLIGGQAIYLNSSRRAVWGATASHLPYVTARTFISQQPVEIDGEVFLADVIEQVRQETIYDELSALTHYPFSQTRRVEARGGYTRYGFDAEVERVVIVGNTVVDRQEEPLDTIGSLNLYEAGVAYVGDNSYYGLVSPVRGGRLRLAADATLGDLEFTTITADLRRYFLFRPVTLAVRGLHFGRYGTDSENEIIGPLFLGRQTLVRGYDLDDFDLAECTSVPGSSNCPEFDRLIGSRIGVLNLELRVPLFGTEDYGLFEFRALPTEIALFVDAGVAWTQDESPELVFEEESLERVPVVSAGVAARIVLLRALPIQLFYAFPFQRPEQSGVFGIVIAPGW